MGEIADRAKRDRRRALAVSIYESVYDLPVRDENIEAIDAVLQEAGVMLRAEAERLKGYCEMYEQRLAKIPFETAADGMERAAKVNEQAAVACEQTADAMCGEPLKDHATANEYDKAAQELNAAAAAIRADRERGDA